VLCIAGIGAVLRMAGEGAVLSIAGIGAVLRMAGEAQYWALRAYPGITGVS